PERSLYEEGLSEIMEDRERGQMKISRQQVRVQKMQETEKSEKDLKENLLLHKKAQKSGSKVK
ncbi:unnamed protein product, partial [Coccothraustes coccothraustes]